MTKEETLNKYLKHGEDTYLAGQRENIYAAMEEYAKQKWDEACEAQRKICFASWQGMPEWEGDTSRQRIERAERTILNIHKPEYK